MLSCALRPIRPAGISVRCASNEPWATIRKGEVKIPELGRDPPSFELKARHPNWPKEVKIVEVGPRDGLQNEPVFVRTEDKIKFIKSLVDAGLKHIEATSFVSERAVPQLRDCETIMKNLPEAPDVNFSVLVPNEKHFARALAAGAKEIAVFTSPSSKFVKANMKSTIPEVNDAYKAMVKEATSKGIAVRGYLSCVITCPYSGFTNPKDVAVMAEEMISWGCHEISLGDTTGAGTPGSTRSLLYHVLERLPANQVALHCHDTFGQALANVLSGLEMGITTFDSSAGGLGGCPFARRSTGNLATEDLVFMLSGMKIKTGVDLLKLIDTSRLMAREYLHKRKTASRVAEAFPIAEFGKVQDT